MTVGELIAYLSDRPLDEDVVFAYDVSNDYNIKQIEIGKSINASDPREAGFNVDHFHDRSSDPGVRTVTRIRTW